MIGLRGALAARKHRHDPISGRLEVLHDGQVFDEKNVCGIGDGTTADDLSQIGKFGVGFKSIYAYFDRPEVHSGDEPFRIENPIRPIAIPGEFPDAGFITLFKLPFRSDASTGSAATEIVAARRVKFLTQQNESPRLLKYPLVHTVFSSAAALHAPTFPAMERYEAVIEKTWRELGLGHLFVVRRHSDGSADVGFFLVDVWCLGVKDAFNDADVPESELEAYIAERMPESGSERIHPACAKKLIEGAIAYAERLGIAPHRDFRKARRVLSGIDASLCPTEFTFGRDGRPCFVRGPHDTDERVDRVLALLTARCGEDGYDFEDPSAAESDDYSEDVRADLIDWLDAEPPEVPRFYRFSGMVTALQICPQPVSPTKLLEVLWGPEGRVWADEQELNEFTTLLVTYWNHAGDLLEAHLAPEAGPGDQAVDVWEDEFPEGDVRPYLAAMIDWAGGFMQTTELWPEAWGDALRRPELAEHWEVVRWWAEFIGTGNKDRIADAAEGNPPRTIDASVTALARALRPPSPSAG